MADCDGDDNDGKVNEANDGELMAVVSLEGA